jgi:cell wall-associated NlpC family hydrolase
MEHKICVVPVMPLRSEPSHRSEMVSQLLFGECGIVLEQVPDGWLKIRNQFDQYEGWCPENQLTEIQEDLYHESTEEYTSDPVTTVDVSGHPMSVPLGSFLKGMRHGEMYWGKVTVTYKGNPLKPDHLSITEKQIRHIAFQYLNTPYLWGGRSNFGIDCSGFVQSVYRLIGKVLPRDAYLQARCGEVLERTHPPHCGDLAFFKNKEDRITHVGMMLNDFEIIHASGKVRVDKLDEYGIVHADSGAHTHQLAIIKRFF